MKDILNFLNYKCVAVKLMPQLVQFDATVSIHAKVPAVLPTIAFTPSSQMSKQRKRQIAFYVIMKIVLTLHIPKHILGSPGILKTNFALTHFW